MQAGAGAGSVSLKQRRWAEGGIPACGSRAWTVAGTEIPCLAQAGTNREGLGNQSDMGFRLISKYKSNKVVGRGRPDLQRYWWDNKELSVWMCALEVNSILRNI